MAAPQVTLEDIAQLAEQPEDACIYFKQCRNTVAHNGQICGECLDRIRAADRGWHENEVDTYPEWLDVKLSD